MNAPVELLYVDADGFPKSEKIPLKDLWARMRELRSAGCQLILGGDRMDIGCAWIPVKGVRS